MTKIAQFDEIGPPANLTIVDRPLPVPKPEEVQVAMKIAGLNRAELMFLNGTYIVQPNLPSMLGIEGAGTVHATGRNVRNVAIGDRVAIVPTFSAEKYGVLGQVVTVPATSVQSIPDDLPFDIAASAFVAYLTAWGGLVHAGGLKADAGQVVLVPAASSSVGIAAIQLAKQHGATVIATTRGREKVDAIKAQGPDHIIVTDEEHLPARVMEITDGEGFDICFDCIAGRFIEVLAEGAGYEAVFVEYGLLSLEETPIPFLATANKALCFKGFHVIHDIITQPDRLNRAMEHVLPRLSDGTYRPVIDSRFALEQVADAHDHMASNAQVGKILITI